MADQPVFDAGARNGLCSREERGATAVEYALILAAIAAVIILVVVALGTKVIGLFSSAEQPFPS